MFFVQTPQVRFDYDYSYDGVMRSYEDSLERLRLDRVDIVGRAGRPPVDACDRDAFLRIVALADVA